MTIISFQEIIIIRLNQKDEKGASTEKETQMINSIICKY